MPTVALERNNRLHLKREAYRQQLIAKGVVDGGSKMRTLLYRKFK